MSHPILTPQQPQIPKLAVFIFNSSIFQCYITNALSDINFDHYIKDIIYADKSFLKWGSLSVGKSRSVTLQFLLLGIRT